MLDMAPFTEFTLSEANGFRVTFLSLPLPSGP
jgi:hypothetical protein